MSLSSAAAVAALPFPPAFGAQLPGARDFDFLFGRWRILNRRLTERLAGADTWETFEARSECRPLLGGLGNLETYETAWQGGYRGIALRLFEAASRRWRIHWASSGDGVLQPAVVGGFDAGVGVFIGPEMHGEREVLSRYRWSGIEADRATWDQAWSEDAGRTWETNWVMQFTRVRDAGGDA